jgi:nucleoside-diphosphate kinase
LYDIPAFNIVAISVKIGKTNQKEPFVERTLILLKPDSVKRAVVGEVLTRFERAGLKIVGMKMINPDYDHYHEHYEGISGLKSRIGDEAFQATLDFMQESPVIAAVLEGIEAISLVRKMVGSTEPKSAQPGTIRGDYAHVSFDHANARGVSIPNLIHASGNAKEAKAEIAHWFSESELFDYMTVHEVFTQA